MKMSVATLARQNTQDIQYEHIYSHAPTRAIKMSIVALTYQNT